MEDMMEPIDNCKWMIDNEGRSGGLGFSVRAEQRSVSKGS